MAEQQIDPSENIVLMKSEEMPEGTPTVLGYDFNSGIDYHKLFQSFLHSGFQATNFGRAVEEINKMIACREEPMKQTDNLDVSETIAVRNNCTIFLGYTSNMASCGVRETIRYLVEHRLVDCLVTTAGGAEEDLIKCLAPTYLGDFHLKGRDLRLKGINRIGNLLVPNNNYCKFEDWVMPILDTLLEEQKTQGTNWTPSKIMARLGKEIGDKTSIAYWAAINHVPIFSPALTDGSLGDMIYFHGIRNPGLKVDIAEDLHFMNQLSKKSLNTGMLIVGGGLVKHHICNSNLMRNGANFSIFLNTANEFDGSDSGARPDEAVSWGKIKLDALPVKIYGEASIIFPLLVGETFARHQQQKQQEEKD